MTKLGRVTPTCASHRWHEHNQFCLESAYTEVVTNLRLLLLNTKPMIDMDWRLGAPLKRIW